MSATLPSRRKYHKIVQLIQTQQRIEFSKNCRRRKQQKRKVRSLSNDASEQMQRSNFTGFRMSYVVAVWLQKRSFQIKLFRIAIAINVIALICTIRMQSKPEANSTRALDCMMNIEHTHTHTHQSEPK